MYLYENNCFTLEFEKKNYELSFLILYTSGFFMITKNNLL